MKIRHRFFSACILLVMIGSIALAANLQNQTITVKRELVIGWSSSTNTYSHNWFVTVTCGTGKNQKTFKMNGDEYARLYWDAVHEAQEEGAVTESSFKTKATQTSSGTYYVDTFTATTTYQGKCVTP